MGGTNFDQPAQSHQVYWHAFAGILLPCLADLAFAQAISFGVSVMSSTRHRRLRGIDFLEQEARRRKGGGEKEGGRGRRDEQSCSLKTDTVMRVPIYSLLP